MMMRLEVTISLYTNLRKLQLRNSFRTQLLLSPFDSPSDVNVTLSRSISSQTSDPRGKGRVAKIPYHEPVGTLLWLSLGIRLDT